MWRNFLNLPLGMVSMATEGSAVKEFSISTEDAMLGVTFSCAECSFLQGF